MPRYTAKSLEDIASLFDLYEHDQIAMIGRMDKTAKDRREREIRARTWREAAEILRSTDIASD